PALEQEDVPPESVQLPEPLANSDLAEAARLVETDRRLILGEDAGRQRPVARLLGAPDELRKQRATEPGAARLLGDVDAHLADTAVAMARGRRRQRGPADDRAIPLRHDPQLGMRRVPSLPRRRLRLEGRVAAADAFLVDRAHRRPVVGPKVADGHRARLGVHTAARIPRPTRTPPPSQRCTRAIPAE